MSPLKRQRCGICSPGMNCPHKLLSIEAEATIAEAKRLMERWALQESVMCGKIPGCVYMAHHALPCRTN